jgi:rhodanese-related sulfurtransferase
MNHTAPGTRQSIWPASLKEAGLVLLAAMVVAAANWLAGDEKLSLTADPSVYELELYAPLVEIAAAQDLFDEGIHLFIDTRPGDPTDRPTIAGAFVIREETFDDDLLALFDDLYPEDPVVVFGNGDLVGANNVAGRLQGRGFGDVQILRGGLAGWEKAGGMVGTAYLPEGPGGSAAAGGGW